MFLEDELLLVMQDDAVLEQADAVHWLVQEAGLEELAGIDAGKCYFVSSLHLNRLFGWGGWWEQVRNCEDDILN